ncbi:uncharacterized protein F5147DRAFT_141478 [Suillus discolor]|uniref:Uncharacterized protein n=1 Tax=Suillus discolor TaxID=1912936 RepID=A0A9P7F7S9_9AGAM|nr:uncharacterized protein F5147DRAFT_141478 [Suillus discolor]KAG2109921.1 hypothetical protein F5147DRAFT_141478 [Suillus discolor]
MLSLSAYLASTARNSTYTDAAILSADFIKASNMNSGDLVLNTINAQDCTCSSSSWLFTYNTGKYIEGLSVLGFVTGDTSWTSFMLDNVAASTKVSAWEGSDGIIHRGAYVTNDNDGVGLKVTDKLKSWILHRVLIYMSLTVDQMIMTATAIKEERGRNRNL